MPEQKVDSYARRLDRPVQQAVHDNSAAGTEKRYGSLAKDFTDADSLRRLAGAIRQHSIENLDTYLEQLDRADFVLLAEPGMSDLDSRLPSTPLAGPILEAVRARPEFVQIAALPAIGGKQILLFEKQRYSPALRQRPGP